MNESTNTMIDDHDLFDEAAATAIGSEQADFEEEEVQVELTLEQIVDMVLESSNKTEFTLYGLSTVLNAVLEAIDATKEGKPYRVRSQMMYQYNTNKLIVKDQNGKGVKADGVVTLSQAREFIIRFSKKFAA